MSNKPLSGKFVVATFSAVALVAVGVTMYILFGSHDSFKPFTDAKHVTLDIRNRITGQLKSVKFNRPFVPCINGSYHPNTFNSFHSSNHTNVTYELLSTSKDVKGDILVSKALLCGKHFLGALLHASIEKCGDPLDQHMYYDHKTKQHAYTPKGSYVNNCADIGIFPACCCVCPGGIVASSNCTCSYSECTKHCDFPVDASELGTTGMIIHYMDKLLIIDRHNNVTASSEPTNATSPGLLLSETACENRTGRVYSFKPADVWGSEEFLSVRNRAMAILRSSLLFGHRTSGIWGISTTKEHHCLSLRKNNCFDDVLHMYAPGFEYTNINNETVKLCS